MYSCAADMLVNICGYIHLYVFSIYTHVNIYIYIIVNVYIYIERDKLVVTFARSTCVLCLAPGSCDFVEYVATFV